MLFQIFTIDQSKLCHFNGFLKLFDVFLNVDNFVFSEELELSIIEHRLTILIEQLSDLGVNIFFPALIYNESFWKLALQKRHSILLNNQIDWAGDKPMNSTFFYLDDFYIDLLKSIKLNFFSYSKVSLETLLQTLKTKTKFSISEYSSFGDSKNNNLLFINDLNLKYPSNQTNTQKSLLGKIVAIKYYSKFFKKDKIKAFVLIYEFDENFWDNFLASIEKIEEKQNQDILKRSEFYFGFITNAALRSFEEKLTKNKKLQEELERINYKYEVIDFSDFKLKSSFDFILIDGVLSVLPTEVLRLYGRDFYHATNRLTYIDRENQKIAIEKISELTSPNVEKNIEENDLSNISIEISWEVFENKDFINLISSNKEIIEREFWRESVSILKVLVTIVKSLSQDGFVQIFDYADEQSNNYNIGLTIDENNLSRFFVDFNTYLKILNSFEDIKVSFEKMSIKDILAKELYDNKVEITTVDDFLAFLYADRIAGKDFFNIEKFEFNNDLKKIVNDLSKYQSLKKKNMVLFGIPTLLYNTGLNQFNKRIKSLENVNKLLSKRDLILTGQDSFEEELIANILPKIIEEFSRNKNLFIFKDRNSKQNTDFKELLKECLLKEDIVFDFIEKNWDKIAEIGKKIPDSYQSLEIIKN